MDLQQHIPDDTLPAPQVANEGYTGSSVERILFSILPTLVLILLSPVYLRQYYLRPVVVHAGRILWAKLIAAASLFLVDLYNFRILRSASTLPIDGSLRLSASSCVATLCVALVIHAEHRRALQSSALTGVYLLIALLFDVARARSYFNQQQTALCGAAFAGASLKFILLLLLEIPKRRQIEDPELRKNSSEEALSGFWSRSTLLWLQSTLFLGFRTILSVNDLSALGPEFSPQALSDKLALSLRTLKKSSRYYLLGACIYTFPGDVALTTIPRLCYSGFVFCTPLFLNYVITYVAHEYTSRLAISGLIMASAVIFLGIAITRSLHSQMSSHLVTKIRGALIPLLVKKTLVLPRATVNEYAAITLMSTDIEGIIAGIPEMYAVCGSYIDVGLGLYLLSNLREESAFAIFLCVLGASVLGFCLAKMFVWASSSWKDQTEKRVSQTANILSQMKSVKMVGLENAVSIKLQNSRAKEITAVRKIRTVGAALTLLAAFTYEGIHINAIAGGLFWTSFDRVLSAPEAFTTLAIAAMTSYPLMEALSCIRRLESTITCFARIQKYLRFPESHESVGNISSETLLGQQMPSKPPEPQLPGRTVELEGAYIAPSQNCEPLLNNVTCSLRRSQITAIIGPVASGKTTLLRAILGEAALLYGHISRKDCNIAYCGQKPWLRNTSIRKNIIGPKRFDPVWYEVVLNACALNHDLQQLLNRDSTVVSSNGANLSGGQKHRIALARALYSRAPIILLDDIFGGLDKTTAQDIHNRLLGPKGMLRNSNSTVVFATHSVSFVKAAHQAFILDGSGTIAVQPEPSKIVFPNDYVSKLEQDGSTSQTMTPTESSSTILPTSSPEYGTVDNTRQRGDLSLYRYFVGPTRAWKIILALVFMVVYAASERFPEILVHIWLKTDAANADYFFYYVASAGISCFICLVTMWFYFLTVVPRNSLQLHRMLLDSVTGATLSFLSSANSGSILNRFSHDLTLLTEDLPKGIYNFIYFGSAVILDTVLIASGTHHSAVVISFLILALYVIQVYYLRTSRQMRHLDTEAITPLYTLFTEIESGLEHIRGFGWQENFIEEGLQALDISQRPYYYKLAIKRWLALALDFTNFGLAIILVSFATVEKATSNPPAVGLSMLSLLTYSSQLNLAVGAWASLETGMAGVERLRAFVRSTPAEERGNNMSLPPRWPETGNVVFSDVTTQYSQTDGTPVLSNVSLTIQDGHKVGISGRSGSGKTSMLLTMLRLMDYTGTITIDGIDISTIPPQQLRSRITTISQDSIKLDGSVRENLLPYEGQLDDKTITDDIIFEALDQVELTGVIEGRGGLNVSLSSMDLSEGQIQLLCLGRAIVHNTCTQSRVVLLDEPTSNLDLETDNRIQAAIRDAFLDCTILMVSHRPETLWDSNVRYEVGNKGVKRIVGAQHPPQIGAGRASFFTGY